MRNKGIYTIWDKLTEEYSPLFLANNHAHAIKIVGQIFSNSVDKVEDVFLYRVGEFDTDAGTISKCVKIVVDLTILSEAGNGKE